MSQGEANDDDFDPRLKLRANQGDKLHALQLLRDLSTINARTVDALGPLPPGGMPIAPRRKPSLPAPNSRMPPSADAGHQENETMDLKPMAVAASMALAACTPTENSSHDGRSPRAVESRKNDSPMQAHKFRLNPHPMQRYEITLTIRDAPGPFERVGFGAAYEAKDCSYVISEFGGIRGNPDRSVEMQFKKLDSSTYVGTMYLDAMIDEDYYGNGVCHWRLTGMGVELMATGAEEETRFSSSLDAQSILAQESETIYFLKEDYPKLSAMDGFITSGQKNRRVFASKYEDDDLFTAALTAKKVQP